MKNDLKDFLKTKEAAQILFKLVHGVMADVHNDDMHVFLEEYVEHLDGGLTEKKMREACFNREKDAGASCCQI